MNQRDFENKQLIKIFENVGEVPAPEMDQSYAKLRNHMISLEQKEKWEKGRGGGFGGEGRSVLRNENSANSKHLNPRKSMPSRLPLLEAPFCPLRDCVSSTNGPVVFMDWEFTHFLRKLTPSGSAMAVGQGLSQKFSRIPDTAGWRQEINQNLGFFYLDLKQRVLTGAGQEMSCVCRSISFLSVR